MTTTATNNSYKDTTTTTTTATTTREYYYRDVKIRVPRWLINLAHRYRVWLHPRYADEHYPTGIPTKKSEKELRKLFTDWGCAIDHHNQYIYPNQVLSGHIYLGNGRQLHIRAFKLDNGSIELKAHVEWHGMTHPIRHILYSGLDYNKGYKLLKKLLRTGKI